MERMDEELILKKLLHGKMEKKEMWKAKENMDTECKESYKKYMDWKVENGV